MKGNKTSGIDKIRKKRESYLQEKAPSPPEDHDIEIHKSMQELQKLTIKDDELKKIRQSQSHPPPRQHILKRITVRMSKPKELEKRGPRMVVVAKPASPDAHIRSPDLIHGFHGPKFDNIGRLVSHSIAGNYADFYSMAHKADLDFPLPRCGFVPLKKADPEVQEISPQPTPETQSEQFSCAEMKALRNWNIKMAQRRMQQNYNCKILERQPHDLVMNQTDNIRSRVELCEVIDRVLPLITSGKGYRKKSEFWRQQERFGDELEGIFASLNLTEKGMAPDIEHVGVPPLIRQEKGMVWHPANTPSIQHPWDQNYYLLCRKAQLHDLMEEEDNQHPDFEGLEVIGWKIKEEANNNADKLLIHSDTPNGCDDKDPDSEQFISNSPAESSNNYADLSTCPSVTGNKFCPALIFDGVQLQWVEERQQTRDKLSPLEKWVIFETVLKQQKESHLDITNNGTTAIFYYWKKLPKDNPFNIFHPPVQRFYFNDSDGVILPGMTLQFPFTFKSSDCGIYSEQWLFETHPVLQSGAPIILTLRGTIIPEDKFCEERKQLRDHLEHLQQEHLAERMVNDLCSSICSEDPPLSPIDAYITQEERFRRKNRHLHYDHKAVREMQQIYAAIFPDAEEEGYMWNFSVIDLAQIISSLEESEKKEGYLNRFEESINQMQFQSDSFRSYDLYQCGYSLLGDALDLLSIRLNRIWENRTGTDLPDFTEIIETQKELEEEASSFTLRKHKSRISQVALQRGAKSRHSQRRYPNMNSSLDKEMSEADREAEISFTLCYEKIYIEVYDTLCETVDRMVGIFSSLQQKQLLDGGFNESLERQK